MLPRGVKTQVALQRSVAMLLWAVYRGSATMGSVLRLCYYGQCIAALLLWAVYCGSLLSVVWLWAV